MSQSPIYASDSSKNDSGNISRRRFLQNTSTLAASAALFSIGNNNLFGASRNWMTESDIPSVELNNGRRMPMVGLGTNQLRDSLGERSVADAISVGYRLLDTATIYGNEDAVGRGIERSGIDRKELFVTSKLWVDDTGYESTKKAFDTSLNKLRTDYLDLYLLHRPRGDIKGSWQAMEELYDQGKIRCIGISNFDKTQIQELLTYARVKPSVNQIECHVFFHQHEARKYLKELGIQMESWSPFAAGRNNVFSNPIVGKIGKKHGKSHAQVCLRWHYQQGVVSIPRSSQKAHMIENLDIFDFELDDKDMATIEGLDQNTTQFPEWR